MEMKDLVKSNNNKTETS